MKTFLFDVKTTYGIYTTVVDAECEGEAIEKCKKQQFRLHGDTFAKVIGTPKVVDSF